MKESKENKKDWKPEDDLLFKPLDEMGIPEPSASLKESFSSKLSHITASESYNLPNRHIQLYLKIAAIAAVFVFGWFIGSINNRNERILLQDVQKQLDNNNKLLVLTLLQQPSFSDRLQATNISFSLPVIDNQVISALVKALESDPDPNVKMRCAEVLANHLNTDSISKIFGNALDYQEEPIIQLFLINYLKSIGNVESKRIINNFINSDKASDFVRTEIQHSINPLQ
jgi:hypothetical protein